MPEEPKNNSRAKTLAVNFFILLGLVLGGWFIYYSLTPAQRMVAQNKRGVQTGKAQTNEVTKPQRSTSDGKPYADKNGFMITPPQGWVIQEGKNLGVAAIFFNPIQDNAKETLFNANINVVFEPTKDNLENYLKSSKEALLKNVEKYRFIGEQKITVNKIPAYIIGGVFMQNNFQLRNKQLITIRGGRAYIVTGTALDTTWSKYDRTVNNALLSFIP